MQAARHDRNLRLTARLQELGFNITFEEVKARGRGITARPHFAQVMLAKGYVSSLQHAFDAYLDESAIGYVPRREPTLAEGIQLIRRAGGITSLAHPIRLPGDIRKLLPAVCEIGLDAIEVYHSDHDEEHTALYLELAAQHSLLITGGSDFHGTAKPGIHLGSGRDGKLRVPAGVLEDLKTGRSVGLRQAGP
jgi:predicted metal-dependent phosphoesterase TrpH